MSRIRSAIVAVTLVLAAASAAHADTSATAHAFGTRGASFESGKWERVTLSADLGKDQFRLVGNDVFLAFVELEELYERRGDFVESLDQFVANVETRMQNVAKEPEIGFERHEAFSRATCRVRGTLGNLELRYRLDVISAGDGVGYLLLSWSLASQVPRLEAEIDALVESIALPGPGSEWHAKTIPTPHAVVFGDWTVEIAYADSIVKSAASEPGVRYSFTADGGDTAIHLFVDELEGEVAAALASVIETAAGEQQYSELERQDLALPAGSGAQVILRSAEEPSHDMAVAVVALEPGRWLDLRMVTTGSAGHRERLWQSLLDSLRATREDPVDAFPVVAGADDPSAAFRSEAADRLLAGSRLLGTADWSHAVEIRPGGTLVVRGEKEVVEIAPPVDAEPGGGVANGQEAVLGARRVLHAATDRLPARLLVWGEETLLAEPGKELQWVVAGELHPAGFRAEHLAADGEQAVLARSDPQRTVLGLGALPIVGPSRIVVRSRAGEEREIQQLADRRVVALAHRGGRALVAAEPREPAAREDTSIELLLMDIRGGAARSLDRFVEVSRVAPAAGGWLVSGTAASGETGVFLLAEPGHRELLLAGDLVGLALDAEEMTFLAEECPEAQRESARCIYRAPLALVREQGPSYWPLGRLQLDRVAAETRRRLTLQGKTWSLPATRPGLAAFIATAQQVARDEIGVELPTVPPAVDLLLSELAYDHEISAEAIDLLAALLSEALLSEGGQWVDADAPEPSGSVSWEASNSAAIGLHPVGVVRSTLYDEDGWYRPAESLGNELGGRTLFLGTDRTAVQGAVDGVALIELPALVRSGSTAALLRVLSDRPGNVHLREQVYRQLAAHGRDRQLLEVAGAFATRPEAAAPDLVAYAAARLEGSPAAPVALELVAMLRAGIERAPARADLYLLLGAAYERTALPDRERYARACYEKAVATTEWGHVGEASRAALERLVSAP